MYRQSGHWVKTRACLFILLTELFLCLEHSIVRRITMNSVSHVWWNHWNPTKRNSAPTLGSTRNDVSSRYSKTWHDIQWSFEIKCSWKCCISWVIVKVRRRPRFSSSIISFSFFRLGSWSESELRFALDQQTDSCRQKHRRLRSALFESTTLGSVEVGRLK